MEIYNNLQKGERGVWLSIVVYILLSVLKIVIGYVYNSKALQADGFNNATDIVASAAVLIGLKISRKPPDKNHRYGHFRAETVATLLASFIMAVVGVQVLVQSIRSFFQQTIATPSMITAWTALFCGIVMLAVYWYNLKLAKATNSSAVMAAAQDNKSDAFVSFGVFVGIVGSQLGIHWLDPLAAAVVGIVICKTAIDILKDAIHSLTDGFDHEELSNLRKTIMETPGVYSVKDIKARAHGNFILVDVTIMVDEMLNVKDSHLITEEIEQRMNVKHFIEHVHIHIEPYVKKQERKSGFP